MEGLESIFSTENSPELEEYKISPLLSPVKVLSLHPENGQIASDVSQVVWPSAAELSKYLIQQPNVFKGASVIELGAGTGLLGLALYLTGTARSILLTDGDFKSVELLNKNIALNKTDTKTTIASQILEWDKPEQIKGEEYDLVVCSDVMYSPEATVHLLKIVKALMKKEGGKCFMANGRYRFSKCIKEFDEFIKKEGLCIEKSSELENNVLLHILTPNKKH